MRSELFFVGTGGGDWHEPRPSGDYRRHASLMLDGEILIDLTPAGLTCPGADFSGVRHVLFTHSHSDHYQPKALARFPGARVYASETWAGEIDFPRVTPVRVGEPLAIGGFQVTPLRSNHFVREGEQTLHYLFEKGDLRVLYATDGAWMATSTRAALDGRPLDAWIVDATVGPGLEDDWRAFEHNTLQMVEIMARAMRKSGLFKPGAQIFLTHMAKYLYPEGEFPTEEGFAVPFDGMRLAL